MYSLLRVLLYKIFLLLSLVLNSLINYGRRHSKFTLKRGVQKSKKNSSQNFDSLHLSYTFSRALIYETVNFKIASQNYGDTVNSHVTVNSENYFL